MAIKDEVLRLLKLLQQHRPIIRFDDMLIHLSIEETSRDADVHRRFDLITSKHPDLHTCALHELDGVSHFILQPILNGGRSNELHVNFYEFVDLLHFFFPVNDLLLRPVSLLLPFIIFIYIYDPLRQKQSPQPLLRIFINKLLRLLHNPARSRFLTQPRLNNRVSTLTHKHNVLTNLQYYTHPFP